jgi:aldehyde:ferredoxin oxidoreductase
VPDVKGQAISGYKPRTIERTRVTYALSALGADHTDAHMIGPEVLGGQLDPLSLKKR